MVTVIKTKEEPKQETCRYCESTLEYTYSDVKGKETFYPSITCPICNEAVCLPVFYMEEDEKVVTAGNAKFPDGFHDFSGGMKISDETINQWIRECVDNITEDDDWYGFSSRSSGDTIVFAKGYGDEINVCVCRGHYEAYINK
jgi:hypothetical protein